MLFIFVSYLLLELHCRACIGHGHLFIVHRVLYGLPCSHFSIVGAQWSKQTSEDFRVWSGLMVILCLKWQMRHCWMFECRRFSITQGWQYGLRNFCNMRFSKTSCNATTLGIHTVSPRANRTLFFCVCDTIPKIHFGNRMVLRVSMEEVLLGLGMKLQRFFCASYP